MPKIRSSWQRILRLVNGLEPRLQRDLTRVLTALSKVMSLERLEAMLQAGRTVELERLIADLPLRLRKAGSVLERAATQAALLQSLQVVNPLAVEAARRQSARLIRDITTETRAAIRQTVVDTVSAQLTTREAAKTIQATIGLTKGQARAVVNLRANLMARGLSADVIEARVARYGEKLRRVRATMIARTEVMQAANLGQQAAWQQAAQDGELRGLIRTWIVTPDDRLCPICAPMDGQQRELTQPFTSPQNGKSVLVPPIHPQCRCAVGLVARTASRTAAA